MIETRGEERVVALIFPLIWLTRDPMSLYASAKLVVLDRTRPIVRLQHARLRTGHADGPRPIFC